MVRNSVNDEMAPRETAVCAHYWVIDSPDGPVSRGVCKHCGAAKEFHNSISSSGIWSSASKSRASGETVEATSQKKAAETNEVMEEPELGEVDIPSGN